jgi:HD superfamily phosphohydrolase
LSEKGIQTELDKKEDKTFKKVEKDPWNILLRKDKVTKDALDKKDIWLTKTEVDIIDSKDFQRLREVMQIPFADLVYVGATNTRFEHSIGTTDMVQKMIDNINMNADRWEGCERLNSRDMFIARLVGLLHDLAHLSFPHILEDGAIIKERQWADQDRIRKFLGEGSEIYNIIKKNIKEAFEKCGLPEWEEAFKEAIEDIKESLIITERGVNEAKREVVYADIVGNTICADILDYILRDLFHTGLEGQYDARILSFFVVKRVDGKRRVVLRLFKDGEYRETVLTSCMQILELRYQLAAKVYYHHTRRKARAMAVEMVAAAINAGILNKDKLLDMGGIALREYILNFNFPTNEKNDAGKKEYLQIAKNLAESLKNRRLYDVLYETSIKDSRAKQRIEEVEFDWKKRFEFEREIEKLFGLPLGSIIIFAPRKSMDAKKTLDTLVEVPSSWGPVVKTLDSLERDDFPDEYKDIYEVISLTKKTIIRKHELLWKLTVYVNKSVEAEKRKRVKGFLEQWFNGAAPVTAVEAIAEREKLTLAPTMYTQIAEEINGIIAGTADPARSLFTQTLDAARSYLNQLGNKK